MKNNVIPPIANVVRYVKPTEILDDGSVDGSAFRLREHEEGLSVNWYGIFKHLNKDQQLDEVRRLSRINMRRSGYLGEINVGDTIRHVQEYVSLVFVNKPLEATDDYEEDPSHSEIEELPKYDELNAAIVGDMIAECIIENHPALTP